MAKIIRNEELEDYRDFFDDDDIDDDVISNADQPSQVAQHRLVQVSATLRTNILEGVHAHGLSFFAVLFGYKHLTHVSYQCVFSLGLLFFCRTGIACLCKLCGEYRG